jgi:Protein of unknown function (DUF2490)
MIRIIKSLLLCLLSSQLVAQYRDAGLWTEGTLAMEYGKKWEFSAVPELRFNENISQLSRAFVDLGAQYKINKYIQSSFVYRAGAAENDGAYVMRNRIQFGLGFRHKWRDWSVVYSPRWQLSLQAASSEDADIATNLRNRFQLKYGGIKNWDVGSSFEFFHSTSSYRFFEWQNWRWTTQASYELNKRRSLSAGYLIQRKLTGSPQQLDYVVLVGYKYNFKNKKSMKKEGSGKTEKEAP